MAILRIGYILARNLISTSTGPTFFNMLVKNMNMAPRIAASSLYRSYHKHAITRNIQLFTMENLNISKHSPAKVTTYPENNLHKPLVMILAWMLAKEKHILKFANFYMDKGFDVLSVSVLPWQLLWPVKGSQVVAEDVLQFLVQNPCYQPLLIHGFSVGGYFWGEVLFKMKQNLPLYQPLIDRIVGQIWDSAADITEIPVGFPKAVFPRNQIMQTAFRAYINYHLKMFHDVATIHYQESSKMFHKNIVPTPALFLFSKSDPVGPEESNMRVVNSLESIGTQTYVKCWDKSPHVGHFSKHPEEYKAEVNMFLNKIGLVKERADKLQAKL